MECPSSTRLPSSTTPCGTTYSAAPASTGSWAHCRMSFTEEKRTSRFSEVHRAKNGDHSSWNIEASQILRPQEFSQVSSSVLKATVSPGMVETGLRTTTDCCFKHLTSIVYLSIICQGAVELRTGGRLSLIHISEPTR